ncbi:MAG: hypothetical protein QOE93_2359 [Actinomycetota bacterium]|jgi:hypothetical protein|nr:hypothetical protein [Actinomycetota bacterium]
MTEAVTSPPAVEAGSDPTEALLAALSERLGAGFELSAARLPSRPPRPTDSDDTCVLCDTPKDACTSCDASDFTCNKQHDIVCVTCDEGDLTCPRDGACNLIGDISCGSNDK